MNKMQVFVAGLVAGGTLTFSASGATASRQGASSRAYSYDVNDECYYTSDCYTVPVGSPGVDAGRLGLASMAIGLMSRSCAQAMVAPASAHAHLTAPPCRSSALLLNLRTGRLNSPQEFTMT